MNLNFPPIVYQEFFIDTSHQYPGPGGNSLVDLTAASLPVGSPTPPGVHDLAPLQTGWLRDLEYEFGAGGSPRPFNFDLTELGNEGEILSIMAWLGDHNARASDGSMITGNVTENCFRSMKLFIGKFNFENIGSGGAVGSNLNHPDAFHGPAPTDIFYESDTIYPGFGESTDISSLTAGSRLPFFQENFSTPIPYVRGTDPWNTGDLGMGMVWKLHAEDKGGPTTPRSVIRIKITARRYR